MRWLNPRKLVILTVFLALAFFLVSSVEARTYYITRPTYFPSRTGSYVTFDTSLLPLSFTTLYRDTSTRWHFNSYWLTTTTDMNVTAWFTDNWLNYTVDGAGTQEIHNGTKPMTVYFDDVEQTEGDTWSYADGTVTVTTSATEVAILWGIETLNLFGILNPTALIIATFAFSFPILSAIWISLTSLASISFPLVPLTPSTLGILWDKLLEGDFLAWLTSVYTTMFVQPDLFYGILMMIVTGVLYIRTQSLLFCSTIWILVGGILAVAMPTASGIAVFLVAMGIAGMLYKLFTSLR